MKSLNSSERQSAPTGAQTSELKQEASRPLSVASCSLIFSLLEHLVTELDATLCPTGYARCHEIIERREQYVGTKWEGWRVYRLDFGHFYIDIASDGQNPTPHIIAIAEEHCTPDEFLGKLNDGLSNRHRTHEGSVSIRQDFTKYARSIREGFRCLGKDKPPSLSADSVGIDDLGDVK